MEHKRPKPVELTSSEIERLYRVGADDPEVGMNMVSSDFAIVMVNRANERLYGKPMVDLLGKKCYEEFERRTGVCPHCPGAAALTTGKPHVVETDGIRDDGTGFSIEIMAYPVLGPGGAPVGFIEVEQEITERKRIERLVLNLSTFRAAVAKTDNAQRAIRRTLDAALALEGIDSCCAFVVDPATGEQKLVAQRGFPEACLDGITSGNGGSGRRSGLPVPDIVVAKPKTAGCVKSYSVVPVHADDRLAARLVFGSSTHEEPPASTQAALGCMGFLLGSSLDRISAEWAWRDAAVRIKAVLSSLSTAILCVDSSSLVTLWNTAAERLFGYSPSEVLGKPLFFFSETAADQAVKLTKPDRAVGHAGGLELTCQDKRGLPLSVWAFSFPFHNVIGDPSDIIIVAEPLDKTGDRPARV